MQRNGSRLCDPHVVRCTVPAQNRGKERVCKWCSLAVDEMWDDAEPQEPFEHELAFGDAIPDPFTQLDLWNQDNKELDWPDGAPGGKDDGW